MNLTKSYGSFLRRCRLPSRSCKFVIDVGEVSFGVFFLVFLGREVIDSNVRPAHSVDVVAGVDADDVTMCGIACVALFNPLHSLHPLPFGACDSSRTCDRGSCNRCNDQHGGHREEDPWRPPHLPGCYAR